MVVQSTAWTGATMDAIWSSAVSGTFNLYHLVEIAFIVFMIGSYCSLLFTLFKYLATSLYSRVCSTAFAAFGSCDSLFPLRILSHFESGYT